ncbi:EAL domain-containing protein [Devosia sp.]|uniref:sensor domain-containing phosphodiesterase n=1 Tax=Devosia sp. TaxID=1871048 RepID=UPI003A92EB5C
MPFNSPTVVALQRTLHAVRTHLRMDIAYISEISEHDGLLWALDSDRPISYAAGDRLDLEAVYCRRILRGEMPAMILDTAQHPVARALPITSELPVGSLISVPITLSNGTVFGLICCLKTKRDPNLNSRDLGTLQAFAEVAAIQIEAEVDKTAELTAAVARVDNVIEQDAFHIAYQPIVCTITNGILGFECLSRFDVTPYRSPDEWFLDAGSVGLGAELEVAAIRKALAAIDRFPDEMFLSVNASPDTIVSGRLHEAFGDTPLERIVLEITEQTPVRDYARLTEVLSDFRAHGLRVAIDDAGAGFAGLRHIVNIAPDIIKLDLSITRDIDSDASRRAMATALLAFGRETGCRLLAEGVETQAELDTLRALQVHCVQGYLLQEPLVLEEALRFAEQAICSPRAA